MVPDGYGRAAALQPISVVITAVTVCQPSKGEGLGRERGGGACEEEEEECVYQSLLFGQSNIHSLL